MRKKIHRRYGRASKKRTFPAIPPGRYVLDSPDGRYAVIYGSDVVYAGNSSQKAHAVFKEWAAESKRRRGDDVYLKDYERDDEPIREFRPQWER